MSGKNFRQISSKFAEMQNVTFLQNALCVIMGYLAAIMETYVAFILINAFVLQCT